jgi:hypothetical protein
MKYAVEMGSGVTIHITSFTRTGLGIQKLTWGIYRQTHRQLGDVYFFKEVGQNIELCTESAVLV